MPKERVLSPLERRAVDEYLVDLKAKPALMRAGYSIGTNSKSVFAKPHIKAAIEKAMRERAERTQLDADWVVKELQRLYNKSMEERPIMGLRGSVSGWKNDGSTAHRCLETLAKHFGMLTTKVEIDDKRPDTTPMRKYTPEEARAMLVQMEADEVAAAADGPPVEDA